jgi:hypothetical protein
MTVLRRFAGAPRRGESRREERAVVRILAKTERPVEGLQRPPWARWIGHGSFDVIAMELIRNYT